jgi:transcriptional regulator with XRE-family HTH domain
MENLNKEIVVSVEKVLKKIREIRKAKGFSHENMASELDMSPSAYNKLERSETTLSLERLLKIKEILDLAYSDLFDIKTGDTFNQDLKDNAIGYVKHLYQENKEITEKLIQKQETEIAFLKELLNKK